MKAPLPGRFYPVMPDASWVARVVRGGASFVQLRVKGEPIGRVRREVIEALAVTRAAGATLVVNDHWELAIELEAPWVHLGQEDLAAADAKAIAEAGIALGVSTHDGTELETALAVDPDYVALGPIWATKLKKMKWAPQGLDRLRDWVARAGRPVVAIGGLTPSRARLVLDSGAGAAAVVTDLVVAEDPDTRIARWLEVSEAFR